MSLSVIWPKALEIWAIFLMILNVFAAERGHMVL